MREMDEDYEYPEDPRQHVKGVCSECGERCESVPVDCGIGPYEYWGYKSVDRDIRELSPCCEAEVVDEPEEEDEPTAI
jgi:hypothetical protein